jgi:DNA-binding GntR family transcriptional regulator
MLDAVNGTTSTARPLERLTMAQRAAEFIRDAIRSGALTPGQAVPESATAATLGVSRNTVREAFRLLGGEGLLVHHVHRGVVVRQLDKADVRDIYAVRRTLELTAVEAARRVPTTGMDRLRGAVRDAEEAARNGDWRAVSTLNLEFHRGLVALGGSPRLDEFFARVLAELRLAFATVADQPGFLLPYVEENRTLCDAIEAGRWDDVLAGLRTYLARSERTVIEAVRATEHHE